MGGINIKEMFKAGDKVYYLSEKPQIYTLKDNINDVRHPLVIENEVFKVTFTREGHVYNSDSLPLIFHATEENHRKLAELYGIEFEAPVKVKTPREIIQAMLDDGWKYVPCKVTDTSFVRDELDNVADFIVEVSDNWFKSETDDWKHAFPIDPRTGKLITDYVDGQIVTE